MAGFAQTGPGGVGNSANTRLWLKADAGLYTDAGVTPATNGSSIQQWNDFSGNGFTLNQLTGTKKPVLAADVFSGYPAVRFDGIDDIINGSASNAIIGNNQPNLTAFTVFRTQVSTDSRMWSFKRDAGTNPLFEAVFNNGGTRNGGFYTRRAGGGADDYTTDNGFYNNGTNFILSVNTKVPTNKQYLYYNGVDFNFTPQIVASVAGNTGLFTIGAQTDGVKVFSGDIGELIIYNTALNRSEQIIVENYLSQKYNIEIVNDFYPYSTHSQDLCGIGKSGTATPHDDSKSAGILQINNPTDLGNDEWMFFGHNNGDITAWTSVNTPTLGNIQRLERDWIVKQTGSVGNVDVYIDVSTLPALPVEYTDYYLMVDADGVFSSGSTNRRLIPQGGGIYKVANISLADGSHVAISCVRPVVSFNIVSSTLIEPDITNIIEVNLNWAVSTDIDVTFSINGASTALDPADYSISSPSPITIIAGTTTTEIYIDAVDDATIEPDETVVIDIDAVSFGQLGTSLQHIFYINDDDNPILVGFSLASDGNDEGTTGIPIQVTLNMISGSDVTVDYSVTSGSATSGGVDYSLSGSFIISAGDLTATITLFVSQDILSEGDEDFTIALSNPVGAGIDPGAKEFVYVITDDDALPTVQFSFTAPGGAEDVSPGRMEVSLNSLAGRNISVNYTVAAGSATANVDYILANGFITIPAGSLSANIQPVIVDDAIVEVNETFSVTLTTVTGATATIGANSVATYTISDNDNSMSYKGPGGVGDYHTNIVWLRAGDLSSSPVSSWPDASGNSNDLSQGTGSLQPSYVTGVMNGQPVVRFDGTDDILTGPSSTSLLGGCIQNLSAFTIFRSGSTTDSRIWSVKRDGSNNPLLEGCLNYGASGKCGIYNRKSTNPQDDYFSDNSLVYNNGNTYLMSALFSNQPIAGADRLFFTQGTQRDNDNKDILGVNDNTSPFTLGARTSSNMQYMGDVAEYILYTRCLNEAQRIIVENYLAEKYGISIANDIFIHNSHKYEVAGVGQASDGSLHTAAMSGGIFMVSGPTPMANSSFMLFGHDNASIAAWTTSEIPSGISNFYRLAREWRTNITGATAINNVSVTFETSLLPALPAGYDNYILLVDADGDFTTGATQYKMTDNGDGTYSVTNVVVSDNYMFAVGCSKTLIQFSATTGSCLEPQGPGFITISINHPMATDVTVDYAVTGGTATPGPAVGNDFILANGTATITAGNTSTIISLTVIDDITVESDETVILTLSNPSAGVVIGTNSTFTFTIHDDDNARKISFQTLTGSGLESVGNVTITIQATLPSTSPITVDFFVIGGTAGLFSDYGLTEITATIPGDNTSTTTTITLQISEDFLSEPSETVIIQLSNPQNGCLALSPNYTYTYTITDNDVVPSVQFTWVAAGGAEDVTPGKMEVSLSTISGQDVTVNYTVTDVSATNGDDFILETPYFVIIPAGTLSAYISASIINDSETENAETFEVDITGASNASVGVNTQCTYTIYDDEGSLGYTGPGGVGDRNTNLLWLKGDVGLYSDAGITPATNGNPIQQWNDFSGNANNISQATGSKQPVFYTNILNGRPVVRFDGSDDIVKGPASNAVLGGAIQNVSAFTVFKTTTNNAGRFWSFKRDATETNPLLEGVINSTATEAGFYVRRGGGQDDFIDGGVCNNGNAHIAANRVTNTGPLRNNLIDETTLTTSNNTILATSANPGLFTVGATTDGAAHYTGDLSEIIVYNKYLNEAQRIIVDNYLSSKYNITISNDKYTLDVAHNYDVAGVGQASDATNHLAAMSADILKISSPAGLANNVYMLFGHDNASVSSWTTTEAPNAGSNIQRIAREWWFDQTGGTITSVTATIDVAGFPAPPVGYETYVLLVDADGDFSSGATQYPLLLEDGTCYSASNVIINDLDFVTIAVARRVIQFELANSGIFEPNGPALLKVILSTPSLSNVTVDFSVTGGTATDADYSIVPPLTATITPGNLFTYVQVGIFNDVLLESDETVIVTLANANGAIIGSNQSHILTIQDDDNPRKISFSTTSSSGDESVDVITLNVEINVADALNPTQANFYVSGGTATGGGVDFTLISANVVVPAGLTTGSFTFTVTDDFLYETNETVIVSLQTPVNCNLALTNTSYTYTINDNDGIPTVQFTQAASGGDESVSPGLIQVSLSAASGADVTVDYTVTPITALGDGDDYNLPSIPGSIIIPAGSVVLNIEPLILDDTDLEQDETFSVEITGATGATLGTILTNTYTIYDNDGIGFIGPGGVGNNYTDNNFNVLWLRADYGTNTTTSGSAVTYWNDLSGNGNNATSPSGKEPDYLTPAIGGMPAVRFTKANTDYMNYNYSGSSTVVDQPYSVFFVGARTTGNNGIVHPVLGGTTANLNQFITLEWTDQSTDASNIRFGQNTNYSIGTSALVPSTYGIYSGLFSTSTGRFFYQNSSTSLGTNATITAISSIPTAPAIGRNAANYGDVNIAELIQYRVFLNTAQKKIVENYLSTRYGIALGGNDKFDETGYAGFKYDLAGIGRDDASNFHTAAMSANILKVGGADNLGNGEFLLFAHDNGDITAWAATEVPNVFTERLALEWRFKESGGDLGSLTFTVDIASFPALSPGYQSYTLLVDADGDFSSGATIYPMASAGGTLYQALGVSIADNNFVAIGTIRNVTILAGNFDVGTNWSAGFSPGSGQHGIVLHNMLVNVNQTVGSIEISTGGSVTVNNNITLTINNGTITLNGGAFTANTNSTIAYTKTGDQPVAALIYSNLILGGSGIKILAGSITVNGSLNISNSSTTLDASSSGNYTITTSGNWNNSGSFIERLGTVEFIGNTNSSFNCGASQNYYNLKINKTGATDLSLFGTINILNNLNLTGGDLVLGDYDLVFSTGATISNGSATSYIQAHSVGVIKKNIASVPLIFDIPMGDNNNYTKFYFTLNSADLSSSYIMVNTRNAINPNLLASSSYINRYWTLEPSGITNPNYDITLTYIDADVVGFEANIFLSKYSGGTWTRSTTACNTVANLLTWAGVTSFSEYTGAGDNALPINLINFDAAINNDIVQLTWTTNSEINNDYFTVEKSTDLNNVSTVATVKGAGNSNILLNYMVFDYNPYEGVSYYRLKQTDYDGKYTYSAWIAIEYYVVKEVKKEVEVLVYPNPAGKGDRIYFSLKNLQEEKKVLVVVRDIMSREYFSKVFISDKEENSIFAIDPDSNIPPGIYLIIGTTENEIYNKKIIIK
ncbi:MAG: hypothetical protein A2275_13400 [Bacteroidetes bacterium RIFOXYA12_FULL_35_11]|nr:MAG: hypothetical protein A2X01_09180 [Bacteroidetes bacterium GWF2_35_48]OFY82959.1 MAG: hypothetical protein A2275_13400 [Bacteroidetes bacterium RIFOXYA12_FULL_35_11]